MENTTEKLRDDWKNLRPELGNFISRLDNLVQKCEDSETTFKNGYLQGYNDGKKRGALFDGVRFVKSASNEPIDMQSVIDQKCEKCRYKKFWDHFSEYTGSKYAYLYKQLNDEHKKFVSDMIDFLLSTEGKNEN